MTTSIVPEFLAANEAYTSQFTKGDLPMPPGRKVAAVICMDARLLPSRFLGLEEGDIHVIRNAGGLVTDDAIRSLVISHHLLGTQEFVVIHHTDCGMLTFTNEILRDKLNRDLNADTSHIDFYPFSDLDLSVKKDVEKTKSSDLIPKSIPVSGFVVDVKTGRLRQVA